MKTTKINYKSFYFAIILLLIISLASCGVNSANESDSQDAVEDIYDDGVYSNLDEGDSATPPEDDIIDEPQFDDGENNGELGEE
ncbi:MAG: hypothetical protein M9897_06280 [Brumimicrobium sp.]|nr:hypothetical protein [Brumimicrobium sp.]